MTLSEKQVEVKAKAEELTTKLGVKVHPLTMVADIDKGDFVIGYIKEPARLAKARAIDKVNMGNASFAYMELLEACLIDAESDPRIKNESPENDKYNLGACKFCGDLLLLAIDVTEKKN